MIHTKEIKVLGMEKLHNNNTKTKTFLSDLKVETRHSLTKSNEKVANTAIVNISS